LLKIFVFNPLSNGINCQNCQTVNSIGKATASSGKKAKNRIQDLQQEIIDLKVEIEILNN